MGRRLETSKIIPNALFEWLEDSVNRIVTAGRAKEREIRLLSVWIGQYPDWFISYEYKSRPGRAYSLTSDSPDLTHDMKETIASALLPYQDGAKSFIDSLGIGTVDRAQHLLANLLRWDREHDGLVPTIALRDIMVFPSEEPARRQKFRMTYSVHGDSGVRFKDIVHPKDADQQPRQQVRDDLVILHGHLTRALSTPVVPADIPVVNETTNPQPALPDNPLWGIF